jgi:hypothetical protein
MKHERTANARVRATPQGVVPVRGAERINGNLWELRLECGHVQRRRFMCVPYRVICERCKRPLQRGI